MPIFYMFICDLKAISFWSCSFTFSTERVNYACHSLFSQSTQRVIILCHQIKNGTRLFDEFENFHKWKRKWFEYKQGGFRYFSYFFVDNSVFFWIFMIFFSFCFLCITTDRFSLDSLTRFINSSLWSAYAMFA